MARGGSRGEALAQCRAGLVLQRLGARYGCVGLHRDQVGHLDKWEGGFEDKKREKGGLESERGRERRKRWDRGRESESDRVRVRAQGSEREGERQSGNE